MSFLPIVEYRRRHFFTAWNIFERLHDLGEDRFFEKYDRSRLDGPCRDQYWNPRFCPPMESRDHENRENHQGDPHDDTAVDSLTLAEERGTSRSFCQLASDQGSRSVLLIRSIAGLAGYAGHLKDQRQGRRDLGDVVLDPEVTVVVRDAQGRR